MQIAEGQQILGILKLGDPILKNVRNLVEKKFITFTQTHQYSASETLQQFQQLLPISQVRKHVFDGRLPCLIEENSKIGKLGYAVCTKDESSRGWLQLRNNNPDVVAAGNLHMSLSTVICTHICISLNISNETTK